MKYRVGKTVVVALGGSVVFPDDVDWKLLRAFRAGVKKWSGKRRFILVVGGGRLCRMYLEAATKVVRLTDRDKDWVGIHATRANAHLVRAVLHDVADPRVIDERFKMKRLKCPVTVAAGWRPGWSTDFVSVALARDFGATEVIIAGKPSHVYNKDNRKHADAKAYRELTWGQYKKLVPAKWTPGAHAPVDPVAARFAHRQRIKAIVVSGRDLKNIGALFAGREFRGTIIS
jgi:uridylate kinase